MSVSVVNNRGGAFRTLIKVFLLSPGCVFEMFLWRFCLYYAMFFLIFSDSVFQRRPSYLESGCGDVDFENLTQR